MVEKKRGMASRRRSAHWLLWICSGLSTAGLAVNRFFCRQAVFNQERPHENPANVIPATHMGMPDNSQAACIGFSTTTLRIALPAEPKIADQLHCVPGRQPTQTDFFYSVCKPEHPHHPFLRLILFLPDLGAVDPTRLCLWPGPPHPVFPHISSFIYLIKRVI